MTTPIDPSVGLPSGSFSLSQDQSVQSNTDSSDPFSQDTLEFIQSGGDKFLLFYDPSIQGNIFLQDPQITINQFSTQVQSAINAQRSQFNANASSDAAVAKALNLNQFDAASGLTALYNDYLAYSALLNALGEDINGQIGDLNDAINTFNDNMSAGLPDDQNWTDTMNQAISDYNQGLLTDTQFNQIATQYNQYVQTRNNEIQPYINDVNAAINTFANNQAANNAKIEELNAIGAKIGIPPLPDLNGSTLQTLLPTQASAPLTIPVAQLPQREAMSPVPTVGVMSFSDLMANYYEPIFSAQMIALTLNNVKNDLGQAFLDQQKYLLGKTRYDANAFIDKTPQLFFGSSEGGVSQSGGVAVGIMSAGLDAKGMIGQLSQGIYLGALKGFNEQMTQNQMDSLRLSVTVRLSEMGLNAALPTLQTLAPLSTPPTSETLGIAYGATFSDIVAQFVKSDALRQTAEEFVNKEFAGKFDAQQQQQFTDQLTAGLRLSFLERALIVQAQSLGLPGLPQQILGNTAGAPEAATAAAGDLTTQDVVNNPLSLAFIKTQLSGSLVQQQGVPQSDAQAQVNLAVNQAIVQAATDQSGDIDQADLRSKLIKTLSAALIPQATAEQLANQTIQLLQREQQATPALNPAVLNQDRLEDTVAASIQGIAKPVAERIAQEAVSQTLQHGQFTNDQEFSILLGQELSKAGLAVNAAEEVARKAIILPTQTDINGNPMAYLGTNVVLRPEIIGEQLNELVQGTLRRELGDDQARIIADKVVSSLVGSDPSSLLSLLDSQIKVIKNQNVAETSHELASNFRTFVRPSIELYAFEEKLINPAYNLIYSMMTGLMYNGEPEPKYFSKGVEFLV
jgi:hypothetical protein